MLDNLYTDIGTQIKNWAKSIFVVESAICLFGGIIFLIANENDSLTFYGFLIILLGPVVAWVSSWILYAFGQLVEDVHAMRNKEGTAEEVKAKREAEARIKREVELKAQQEAAAKAAREAEEKAEEQVEEVEQPSGEQCQLCGEYFEHLTCCKIKDDMGTRYRSLCDSCIQKHNAIKQ